MPKHLEYLLAVAAGLVAVEMINRSNLKLENAALRRQCRYHQVQIYYLADLLEKHDITFDEFDKIALYNPDLVSGDDL